MWTFISGLVNEMQVSCQNMVVSIFHKELRRAFDREIALYLKATNIHLDDKYVTAIVRCSQQAATGHRSPDAYPPECPAALKFQLEALASAWSGRFAPALPCPTPAFIESDTQMCKTPTLLMWLYALQEHRVACLQEMANLLPPHLPKAGRSVESSFPRKSWKPQPLLPQCSPEVRHVMVNASSLASIVNACVSRGDLPVTERISSSTASKEDFLKHFPGLHSFRKKSRHNSHGDFLFQGFRTDGVCASLLFGRAMTHSRKRKKEEIQGLQEAKRRKKCQTSGGAVASSPLQGKRVVTIDPGRIDMLYAVIGDDDAVQERYTLPTKNFRQRCRTSEAEELGVKCLKKVTLSDGRTLWKAVSELPTARDVFAWSSFLAAYLPLLSDLLRAKRQRCLRRTRFDGHMKRDKVLDQTIRELLGGSLSLASRQKCHVALGAANACSTGFGHASAPQGRFAWRLAKVHKISLTMVDEFRTSQVCHQCHVARLYKAKVDGRKAWQLEACPNCRNVKGTGPRVWHHDFNGAMNIRYCFLEAIAGRERPFCMARGTERLPVSPTAFRR
jgi:hypothetical protein